MKKIHDMPVKLALENCCGSASKAQQRCAPAEKSVINII
jgi:hypothetical protein